MGTSRGSAEIEGTSQGETREEALSMIREAIEGQCLLAPDLVDCYQEIPRRIGRRL